MAEGETKGETLLHEVDTEKFFDELDLDIQPNAAWDNVTLDDMITYHKSAINGELGDKIADSLFESLEDFEKWFANFKKRWRRKILKKLDNYNGFEHDESEEEQMIDANKEEVEEGKEAAELSNKIGPKVRWMKLFEEFSHNNEMAGELLYHALIGKICKDLSIRKDSREFLKLFTHVFWIQDSRTGKDQGLKFLKEILDELNKVGVKLSYYSISNTDTAEAFINTFGKKINAKGRELDQLDFEKEIPGILQQYDFIVSSECSFLFNEDRGRLSKSELLLEALEGKPINKRLIGWKGHQTTTKPNFVFIGLSRPVYKMKRQLLESGLFQRTMSLCRNVNREERANMNEEVFKRMGAENPKVDEEIKQLCAELKALSNFSKNTKLKFEDLKKFRSEAYKFSIYIDNKISERIFDPEIRDLMSSFTSQFSHYLLILSSHNALAKGSNVITLTDQYEAQELIKKLFGNLQVWLEGISMKSSRELKEDSERDKIIKAQFGKKEEIELATLARRISMKFQVSIQYAYRKIQKIAESPNGYLKVYLHDEGGKKKMVRLIQA